MIRLNLLPDEWKKHDRKPLGWIVASAVLFCLCAACLWGIRDYSREVIPRLESERLALAEENRTLRATAGELERVDAGADELGKTLAAFQPLFARRLEWADILRNIEGIFAAPDAGGGMARVLLTRVAGYGRTLVVDGVVKAGTKEVAMVRVGMLVEEIREYAPGDDGVTMANLLADGWPVVKKADWNGGDADEGGCEFSVELLFR